MTHTRIQRSFNNFGAGSTYDIPFSLSGGILLSLKLQNQPLQFHNSGSAEERPKIGDINVIVGDSGNSGFVLGQDATGFISIPIGQTWYWDHPFKAEIIAASSVIEKLKYNSSYPLMPIGVITSGLRVIAAYDPVLQVQHNLIVEAEFIVFDVNIT